MAQLDGEREIVVKLAGEALHVADEVEHQAMAAMGPVTPVVGRRGNRGAGVPGPLLRPYFLMMLADDPRATDSEPRSPY